MPIYTALTAGQLELRLAERMNDLVYEGTATAGGAGTLTDSSVPTTTDSDERIINSWLRVYAGPANGDERQINAYTGSTGQMTASRNFSATPTTSSKYYISHLYRPTTYLRAIQDAQQYQAQRLLDGLRTDGREAIVGNLVPNGMMDLFTTANVPDSLTLDTTSTFTEENTITFGARRSLKIVTDGANTGYVRYAVPRWGKFYGRSVKAYAMVRSSAASRTSLQFADGVATGTATVTTNNVWELLQKNASFSNAGTQAQISLEITAGSAVTAYLQFLYLPDPDATYEEIALDADLGLIAVDGVRVSTRSVLASTAGGYAFGDPLGVYNWSVVADARDTPAKLRLNVDGDHRGCVVEYGGWQRHPELTGVTVTYNGQPQLILPRAHALLLARVGADPNTVRAKEQEAADVEQRMRIALEGSPRRVLQ